MTCSGECCAGLGGTIGRVSECITQEKCQPYTMMTRAFVAAPAAGQGGKDECNRVDCRIPLRIRSWWVLRASEGRSDEHQGEQGGRR